MPIIQHSEKKVEVVIDYPLVDGVRSALPKQKLFHQSLARNDIDGVAYVGGMGCVAGETKLFNPLTGRHERIDSMQASAVYAYDGESFKVSSATRPRQYKKARLYKVTTSRGSVILVTARHKFLSTTGWKRLSSFSVGERLLVSGGAHPLTILGFFLSVLRVSVQRCFEIVRGFLLYCSACSRPYGAQLHLVTSSGASVLPLLDDVHAHSCHSLQMDAHEKESFCNHQHQSSFHHSKSNCVNRNERPSLVVVGHTLERSFVPPLHSCQSSALSQSKKDQLYRTQQLSRSFLGRFWMAYYSLTHRYDTITSIEFEREDIYYDMHVPTYNNYIANGFVNHNSGKTIAGCIQAMYMATKYKGSRGMITANTYPQLRTSTIATFFNLFPEQYIGSYNESQHELRLKNGSIIYFRSVDNPDSLRGSNLLWFYMDEAADSPEYAFQMIMGRWKRPDANEATQWKVSDYKFWLTSNPAGKNWVWKRFYSDDKADRVVGIHAPTTENTFLDSSYAKMLYEMYSPELAKRFIAGDFDSFVGQIFVEWNESIHIIDPIELKPHWLKFRTLDFGMKHPTCCLWIAEDERGCLYVYRELYKSGLQADKLAQEIIRLSVDKNGDPEDYIFTVGDTSGIAVSQMNGKSIFDVLNEYEIHVQNAHKQDQFGRIDRLRFMLEHGLIKVFRSCKHLIEEMPQYQWKPESLKATASKQTPYKVNDHAIDALMYAVAHRPDNYGLPDKNPKRIYTKDDIGKVAVPWDYLTKDEVEDDQWYNHPSGY